MSNSASQTVEPFQYAIVDLAVAETLRPIILGLRRSVAEPLLARDASQKVLAVGPWLVRLSKAPELAEPLSERDTKEPWGFYVYSTIDIVSLRQRLRRMNLARVPGIEREVLFRYWDPRVMKVFLAAASEDQLSDVFEWIDKIEGPNGAFVLDRRRNNSAVS